MRLATSRSVLAFLPAAGYASARWTFTGELDRAAAEALAYPAIALSAWFGGVGPGVATTILCVLTGVVTRVYPGLVAEESTWASLAVLLLGGLLSAAMIGRARRSDDRAAVALRTLEREVRDRSLSEAALSGDKRRLEEMLAQRERVAARHEATWKHAERRRHEAQLLAELTHHITALLSVEALLAPLAAAVRDLCRADRVCLALRDPRGFRVRHLVDERAAEAPGEEYLAADQDPLARVFATGEAYRSPDVPEPTDTSGRDAAGTPVRATMIAPFRIGAGIEGVIIAETRSRGSFGPHDEELLLRVSAIAAVGIRNADIVAGEQSARYAAEARSRAKDEFMAMLGHELRNPLGAIGSALGAMDQIGTHWQRLQQLVGRQNRHLGRLLDDLLDVSRVAVGKIVLRRQVVDLREVVDDALQLFEREGKSAGHDLQWSGRPVRVHGDPARLEQIVRNLLDNAFKYTPRGGTVTVSVAPEATDAVFRVRDTGIGIPAHMLTRIFDVFVQQPRGLDRAEGGLGLGLTLVKQLVELHGGTITAASAGVDQGSEFVVRLPAVTSSVETPPAQGQGVTPARRRVAVVEDQPDAREALESFLRVGGHEVQTAPDGETGLDLILRTQPDVALIDIGLPGLSGYEVAKRLRDAQGGTALYLVAVTGYGQPGDRVRALEAGFNDHLVKPLDPDALNLVLARAR